MSHLPALVSDLAMILLVAGVTTILFKKLNQPLVLGYIIAGFLTGPHFNLLPSIADSANIQSWSEIGVIFLLFALGLEFSFYKLKSVGSTAFIATAIIIGSMLSIGYACGLWLGWSHMDSLFLGGMLSMSSTSIVVKAFEDLKIKGQPFTELVIGILIVEDIAGIVMLVLLSTLAAATADISSAQLIISVLRLIFFLVLWFVLGMYLVPTFFKRARSLMNDETLLVASIGLCLGMVVLATRMGFSSALGSFIMGSLIAEAPNAEEIERLVKPVKDLFGAVFFVSVGMLVNPPLLLDYTVPILCITAVTISGLLLTSTIGVMASGQNLHIALRCGFSLGQIGEFSFIIASLGMSLGVISDFLYPIIVAVSVITTFTTPFFISAAEPAYACLVRLLPHRITKILERYTESGLNTANKDGDWQKFLKTYLTHLLIYVTLLTAIGALASHYLLPHLEQLLHGRWSNLLTACITLVVMSPILRAILMNSSVNSELFAVLWFKKRSNHFPLLILLLFKIMIAALSLFFIFHTLIGLAAYLAACATLAAAYCISSSDWLLGEYLRIESRFLVNLNEKHMRGHRRESGGSAEQGSWFDEDLQLAWYKVPADSRLVGKTLSQSAIRKIFGCNIFQVANQGQTTALYDMPGGDFVITANALLHIIGTAEQFRLLDAAIASRQLAALELVQEMVSMREFMLRSDGQEAEKQFFSCAITIDKYSSLLGKTIKDANIREKWHCLVIGLERGNYTMTNPNVYLVFEEGDLLWVLGKQTMLNALIRNEVL